LEGRKSLIPIERDDHQRTGINYPAAAAGPEGLPPGHEPFRGGAWPRGSCGALKFKTYFHVVIPAPVFPGINSSRNPGVPAKAGIQGLR